MQDSSNDELYDTTDAPWEVRAPRKVRAPRTAAQIKEDRRRWHEGMKRNPTKVTRPPEYQPIHPPEPSAEGWTPLYVPRAEAGAARFYGARRVRTERGYVYVCPKGQERRLRDLRPWWQWAGGGMGRRFCSRRKPLSAVLSLIHI